MKRLNRHTAHIILCFAVFLVLGELCPLNLWAQQGKRKDDKPTPTLYRSRTIVATSDTLTIDSLSLANNSLTIKTKAGKIISDSLYTVDYFKAKLKWKTKPAGDTLILTYSALPFNFTKPIYHKDYTIFNRTDSLVRSGFLYTAPSTRGSIFDLGGVNYNGSFARGISFGNSQDVVVNSSFNLQMQGNLPAGVQVNAALTDNNIPVQPEGNTQQLQEFDKVYIQLKKDKHSLTVGDFELSKPPGYFMNYYRKMQGASYEGNFPVGKWNNYTKASVAVAKGKYARNIFNGTEGNQGPYRLTGNNGESFIIILSGSEKVYINGILLQRGSDADYVIDYNAGEVTFTPKHLINSELRIQVEFEYSDKSYFRSFMAGTEQINNKKWKFTINAYSEQDSKNQPVQQDLDSVKRNVLASVGDSLQKAFTLSADSMAFDANKVMYKKIVDTEFGTIYQYSINPDSAHYVLTFSFVGTGKGRYAIATSTANGRVYKFVPPVNGVLQGNYEPFVLLTAPQKQQLITGAAEFKPDDRTTLSIEASLSNRDLNTFSTLDDANNTGLATFINLSRQFKLQQVEKNPLMLVVSTRYEYNDKNFNPIDNYRPVEFERDWNTTLSKTTTSFNNAFADVALRKTGFGFLQYQFGVLERPTVYTGYQHVVNFNVTKGRIEADSKNSYTTTTSPLSTTAFLRPNASLAFLIGSKKQFKLGTTFNLEENRITNAGSDTLSRASFRWYQYGAFFKTADTAKFHYGITYNYRTDAVGFNNNFRRNSYSDNINFNTGFRFSETHNLELTVSYRKLHILDSLLTSQKEDESMTGRIEYNLTIKRGFINLTTLYQVGSGLEQKQEFTYVEVPAGQGIYAYIGDLNSNGVKDLDEFDVAAYPDQAAYIKVFIPTNDYIKIYTNQFAQSISIQPRVLWAKAKGVKKFAARFGNTLALQFDNKLNNLSLLEAANPFRFSVNENVLVTNNSLLSNTLSFNRIDPVYGIDFTWQRNTNKNLLNTGIQNRALTQNNLRLRLNLGRRWQYMQDATYTVKSNFSQFFTSQNYYLTTRAIAPKLSYQTTNNLRITASYKYQNGANTYGDANNKLTNNEAGLEFRVGSVSKSLLNMKATYSKIKYDGPANSPAQYAILDGLQNGNNLVIGISYDRKLSKVVEMSISYDGRKTGTANFVHVGRAQLRALF